jgi:hypothetical protein
MEHIIMKKLLVIIDLCGSTDLHNFLNRAIGSQEPPEDVLKLADNIWLIDFHKSLSIFASLVKAAEEYKIGLRMISVDEEDIIYFPPL